MKTNWFRLLLPVWDMLMTISDDGAGPDQISLNNQQLVREMKNKQILEEAIGRYPRYIENPPNINALFKWEEDKEFEIKQQCFIEGAKWQAERMYSEEEVNEIITETWLSVEDNEGDETFSQARERILEEFKKTKDGK